MRTTLWFGKTCLRNMLWCLQWRTSDHNSKSHHSEDQGKWKILETLKSVLGGCIQASNLFLHICDDWAGRGRGCITQQGLLKHPYKHIKRLTHTLIGLSLPYWWEWVHISLGYTWGLNICKNNMSENEFSMKPLFPCIMKKWRPQNGKKMEWETIQLQSMRFQYFARNREESFVWLILNKPQSEREATVLLSMCLSRRT